MLKHSPLFELQKKAGAKFTEFAGWQMPLQYSAIMEEHHAVRKNAGLFDISHMGKLFVYGAQALDFLQKLCTNDISKCAPGKALYSHLCNEQGGVIDDIFVYCLAEWSYMVIVNAATTQKDYSWFLNHLTRTKFKNTVVENRSDEYGMLALQGPNAAKIAGKIFRELPARHQIAEKNMNGKTVFLCRTGYTGEDGFEIVAPNSLLCELWLKFPFAKGVARSDGVSEESILPCGLGARDTLRLEMGYLLYGNDIDEEHTPLEAGLSWVVKLDKQDFIGKSALEKQKRKGIQRKLTAFKLKERGIPRHHSKIFCGSQEIGRVTSGTFSPTLQCGIALGYVPTNLNGNFSIACHNQLVPAEVTTLPFYKPPTP